MTSSPVLPTCLLIVLHLLSFISAASDRQTKNGCDTQTAANCLDYSTRFMALSKPEQQYAECANASKSVECLEAMVASCPSLPEDDEKLYTMITQQVATFKLETTDVCSGVTVWTSLMTSVVTTTLVGVGQLLRVMGIL